MLGSLGAIDLTLKNALTITGTPFVGAIYGGNKTVRFNTANYFTSGAKVLNRQKFTVIFVGGLDAPLTTGSCHLFGQFQSNGAMGDATAYDWSIYESHAADGVYLQTSNGTTAATVTPANNPTWVASKQRRVAASFDSGIPRISVDGGAVATGSTLPGGQISSNYGMASGGYWSGLTTYNPFVRIALAVVIDGWAASEAELRKLSENPWQIFRPLPSRIFVPVSTGGGTTAVAADQNASYTITGSVAADSSAAYTLRAAVAAESSASYTLRAAVAADASAAYALRAAVASDLTSSYAIQTAGTVTTGLDAVYALRSSVAGDINVGYQIAAAVQAEVATTYAVRAAVQKDLSAGYAIQAGLSAVSADLIAAYAVDGSTTTRAPSGAGPSIILPGSTRPGSLQTFGRPPNLGGRRH